MYIYGSLEKLSIYKSAILYHHSAHAQLQIVMQRKVSQWQIFWRNRQIKLPPTNTGAYILES